MSKQLNNIVTSNPTVIEFTGKYKETVENQVFAYPGSLFQGGKITVFARGDFDAQSEYLTLKITNPITKKSIEKTISTDKQDWIYHEVLSGFDITEVIQGQHQFTIEVTPSDQVHNLWQDAWGIKIKFEPAFDNDRLTFSNWQLNEKRFEQDEDASFSFDVTNKTNVKLTDITVSLVKDFNDWKDSGLTVLSPANLQWKIQALEPNATTTLSVLLQSSKTTKPGEYKFPQVTSTSTQAVQSVEFDSTSSFIVKVEED